MSSKIIRGDNPAKDDAQPIQWRVRGQAAAIRPAGTQSPRAGSVEDPVEPEQVKQLCANAYQQGLAAGEAASAQRAQAKLDPALASFGAMVAELAGARQKLRAEAEAAAVALAMEVARRVLHREVAADPEAILGLVKAAFQKCDARATQRLRVSPVDAEIIRENQIRLNLPPGLEIASDRSLARGSAIFETSRGDLDASVDTQLAEIDRGLADVLKRRHPECVR
jgi:flagellar assembly protein FliH